MIFKIIFFKFIIFSLLKFHVFSRKHLQAWLLFFSFLSNPVYCFALQKTANTPVFWCFFRLFSWKSLFFYDFKFLRFWRKIPPKSLFSSILSKSGTPQAAGPQRKGDYGHFTTFVHKCPCDLVAIPSRRSVCIRFSSTQLLALVRSQYWQYHFFRVLIFILIREQFVLGKNCLLNLSNTLKSRLPSRLIAS